MLQSPCSSAGRLRHAVIVGHFHTLSKLTDQQYGTGFVTDCRHRGLMWPDLEVVKQCYIEKQLYLLT